MSLGLGSLLIALALGYIVCYLANREEELLRAVGFLIGICIIVLSGLMIVNGLYHSAKFRKKMMGCMMMQKQHKMVMGNQGQMQQPVSTPAATPTQAQ